jgi:hypothetical protein
MVGFLSLLLMCLLSLHFSQHLEKERKTFFILQKYNEVKLQMNLKELKENH